MNFGLTEKQRLFRERVRDFAEREVKPVAAINDEQEKFDVELTKKMAADLLKKGRTNVKGMWSEKK